MTMRYEPGIKVTEKDKGEVFSFIFDFHGSWIWTGFSGYWRLFVLVSSFHIVVFVYMC